MKRKSDEKYGKDANKVIDLVKSAGGSIKKANLVKLIGTTEGLGQQSTAAYNLINRMTDDEKIFIDKKSNITIASE